jgi:ABC-type glutathione transport system ATPase component
MLVVTHEMSFAADVADRVLFIDHGVIVEQGPARDVLTDPQNPRTQAFLHAVLDRAPMTEDDDSTPGVGEDAGFGTADLFTEQAAVEPESGPDDG